MLTNETPFPCEEGCCIFYVDMLISPLSKRLQIYLFVYPLGFLTSLVLFMWSMLKQDDMLFTTFHMDNARPSWYVSLCIFF